MKLLASYAALTTTLLGLLNPVTAKPTSTAISEPSLTLVDDQKFQDSIKIDNLVKHVEAFQRIAYATPERNRVAGSEGHNNTIKYIVDQLKATGDYYDIELQPFNVSWVQDSRATLTVNGQGVEAKALAWSPNGVFTNVSIVPVSMMGCQPSNFPPAVSHALALISRGDCSLAEKSALAKSAGAIGVIMFNNENKTFIQPPILGSDKGVLPTVMIHRADGRVLARAARSGATLFGSLEISTSLKSIYSKNIIATTKRGEDNNVLFLGAHSDSVAAGPGINDNGSGSAGILETAIQLAKWGTKSRVRFAWWTAEEQGLLGSTAYVKSLGALDRAKIRLYLNFDMIASPNYMFQIYDSDGSSFGMKGPPGSGEAEKMWELWFDSKSINRTASNLSGRSDYLPFLKAGIPCCGLDTGADEVKTEEDAAKFGSTASRMCDPNYHTNRDVLKNLDLDAFALMAKGIAHAVATYGRSFDGFPTRLLDVNSEETPSSEFERL